MSKEHIEAKMARSLGMHELEKQFMRAENEKLEWTGKCRKCGKVLSGPPATLRCMCDAEG